MYSLGKMQFACGLDGKYCNHADCSICENMRKAGPEMVAAMIDALRLLACYDPEGHHRANAEKFLRDALAKAGAYSL